MSEQAGGETRLDELSVTALVGRLSEETAAPGGGSAGAISGAIATALLEMSCRISKNDEEKALRHAVTALSKIRRRFLELADLDWERYEEYRSELRDGNSDEESRREKLLETTRIPLRILETSVRAMQQCLECAERINASLTPDLRTAVGLLRTVRETARNLVTHNLEYLSNSEAAQSIQEKLKNLDESADVLFQDAESVLDQRASS